MPHPVDLDFAGKVGDRTVHDNKDQTLDHEPESLANKIKKIHEDAILAGATKEAYKEVGLVSPETKGKPDGESPSVVGVALNQMTTMIKENNEMVKEKAKEVVAAHQEADEARANLFATQLEILKNMQSEMVESRKVISAQNSPEAAVAMVEKWEGIFNKWRPPATEKPTHVQHSGPSDEVTLKLEEMRQVHDLEMKKLDLQIAAQNNEFQLKMLQFNEDSQRRWKEYQDGTKFKENAYNGFSDLAASIAAGIDKERKGVASDTEDTIQATVTGFKCQGCGQHITIPEGAEKVVCETPGCGAEYAIKVK